MFSSIVCIWRLGKRKLKQPLWPVSRFFPIQDSTQFLTITVTHCSRVRSCPENTFRQFGTAVGGEAFTLTPDDFTKFVQAERVKWDKIVKDAGVRIE
jgi:hypothetical protein